MKKLKKAIAIYMFIFLLFSNVEVMAVERLYKEDVYINQGILMNGVRNSYDLKFNIEKNMVLNSLYLNLDFDVSPISEYLHSSMVIYLNNKPIGTYNLHDLRGQNNVIKLEINKDYVKKGENLIRIGVFHGITKEQSSLDEINTANWININNSTYLHLEYIEDKASYKISDFPYPFIKSYNKSNFSIVISDDLIIEESKAAVNLVSSIAKSSKSNIENYKIITKESLNSTINEDLIFLMNYNSLPSEIQAVFSEDEIGILNSNVIIKLVQSPYNEENISMVITSLNNKLLNEGSLILGEKDYISKINSNRLIVNEYEKNNEYKLNNKITLEELGYGTELIYGTKSNIAKYYYKYPVDKEVISGEITLNISHSPNIDFENSKIGIKVNGEFLDERLLEKDAEKEKIKLIIPEELLKGKKAIMLEVIANINGFTEYASKEDEKRWIQIDKGSYFDLQYRDIKDITLDVYGAAFIKDKKIEDLDVIIPQNINYINLASKISEFIGMETLSGQSINLVYDSEIANTEKNAIIIGMPEDNNLVKNLNSSSSIKFNDEYTDYLNNKELAILEYNTEDISTIEIIKSPWNKKKNIILFKSLDFDNLSRDVKYLSDTSYIDPSKGTEVAIGKDYLTTDSNKKEVIEGNDILRKIESYLVGDRKRIIIIFVGTLVIILGISFIIYSVSKSND